MTYYFDLYNYVTCMYRYVVIFAKEFLKKCKFMEDTRRVCVIP